MSEKVISPDLDFVNGVIAAGGESLKKCFQCATCTVVCNVTPEDKPFPRKEMVQAQWGMKEELFRNPDIWLCHQCSDCTAHCPRGAKPGEVLGAIRKMSLEHYSKPGFLAKAVNDPKFLIFLIAVPVLLLLGIISLQDYSLGSIPRGDEGQIVYANFIPMTKAIDPLFILTVTMVAGVFAMGVMSYWRDMSSGVTLKKPLGAGIADTLSTILAHKKFEECSVAAGRKTAHLLVFYSFIILAITTGLAASREWAVIILGEGGHGIEHALYLPMKILGNVGAIGLAVGILMVIMNRLAIAEKAGKGGYYDWLFIGIVVVVGLTGILSELFRLSNIGMLAYPTYFTHLVAVWFLFAYAPFSKMAHMVYRATAMVFANMADRK